jgi:CelD/BcsL family acetyltransferase involved in cellulose biosynthesis
VWHAWNIVAKPQGHQLCTIVGRSAGRVVLIWPAIVRHEKFQGIWRIVSWLGRDPIDYGAVLAEPCAQTSTWITAAAKYLAAVSGADLLSLASVPSNTALHQQLESLCPCSLPEEGAPFIDLSAWDSWSDYEANLPKSFRKNLQRRARRMAEKGSIEFRFDADLDSVSLADTVAWITRHKRDWLKQRGIERWLLTSDEYADAMVRTLADAPHINMLVSRLLVDGETVAADINFLAGDRIYSDYGTFDLVWSKYSPGALLMSESIRWAFDRKLLLFDLGRGIDDYKLKWSSGVATLNRFLYPCNMRGRIYVLLRTSRMADFVARHRMKAWFD